MLFPPPYLSLLNIYAKLPHFYQPAPIRNKQGVRIIFECPTWLSIHIVTSHYFSRVLQFPRFAQKGLTCLISVVIFNVQYSTKFCGDVHCFTSSPRMVQLRNGSKYFIASTSNFRTFLVLSIGNFPRLINIINVQCSKHTYVRQGSDF